MSEFRVVAILSAFNEADVISQVIGHLVENEVDVYLIDNRSTDGTADAAKRWLRKGLLGIEQFPSEPPEGGALPAFDWEGILRRKEELAKELKADWFIHHDADEFREAPWPGMNLRDAIAWVDRLGYNCIDFRVLNFPPLENGFRPGMDPREHFTHWEDPVIYDTLQRKSWKAQATPVSLASSGGHEVQFPDRRVFPIRFLLRHYPIRSQEHGRRKVFDERKKRFVDKERAKGWHVQYDSIGGEDHSFLGDPARLHRYDPDRIRLELILDSEPVRSAVERAAEVGRLAETRQKDLEVTAALKHEAEKHAANLEEAREKLTSRLIDRERHIANLETLKAEAERHAAGLEAERLDRLALLTEREKQVSNLESKVGELERHASGLENDRKTLAAHIAHLEEVRVDRDRHVRKLEEIRASREAEYAGAAARLAELERHAAGLEKDREALAGQIRHLEGVAAEYRVERDRQVESLEGALAAEIGVYRRRGEEDRARLEEAHLRLERASAALAEIRNSTSWRLTAPLRKVLDAFRRNS